MKKNRHLYFIAGSKLTQIYQKEFPSIIATLPNESIVDYIASVIRQ